jgi:hypothetical protein
MPISFNIATSDANISLSSAMWHKNTTSQMLSNANNS